MTATKPGAGLQRRQLLKLGAAASLAPWLSSCGRPTDQNGDRTLLLSGYRDSSGNANNHDEQAKNSNFGIAGIHTDGRLAFDIAIEQRVHDSLYLAKTQQAIFFARRPGTHFYVVDLVNAKIAHTITAPSQRHFYGHGCTSPDGRYLFTSENAFDLQRGCIGVYDLDDGFKRVEEFSSAGVGPHQIELLSDGKTLVVANGGILTHPARGRKKLNLDQMQPSLAYLNVDDGQLLEAFTPPHHQQSIRHIDIADNDQVVLGIQFQGDASQQLPLAYTHQGETELQALTASELDWQRHQQYVGSVCVNPAATQAMLSSPRGDIISHWDLQSRSLLSISTQRDGAGLAFTAEQSNFFVSNGIGQISALNSGTAPTKPYYFANRSWDNHMSVAQPNIHKNSFTG